MVVDTAWIFDIDGVVTNPSEKRVKEPQILVHIAEKLKSGEPVAFNTGRSSSWLIERVINPLLEMIEEKSILKNFVAVLEKGGCWVTFDDYGKMHEYTDDSITIPKSLHQQAERLIEKKYKDSMFYDNSKQTMVSIEMKDGLDVGKFRTEQRVLVEELTNLLQQNNLRGLLKIDPTTIATDIENTHVGKGFATERILDLLKQKNIKSKQFIAFGDSPSDIAMAHKLHERKLSFTFIFVDNRGGLEGVKFPFPIVYTQALFDKGTLEYLNQHSK